MLTPRRCAQLGLGAASVVFVASVSMLLAGEPERTPSAEAVGVTRPPALVRAPLADPARAVAPPDREAVVRR